MSGRVPGLSLPFGSLSRTDDFDNKPRPALLLTGVRLGPACGQFPARRWLCPFRPLQSGNRHSSREPWQIRVASEWRVQTLAALCHSFVHKPEASNRDKGGLRPGTRQARGLSEPPLRLWSSFPSEVTAYTEPNRAKNTTKPGRHMRVRSSDPRGWPSESNPKPSASRAWFF